MLLGQSLSASPPLLICRLLELLTPKSVLWLPFQPFVDQELRWRKDAKQPPYNATLRNLQQGLQWNWLIQQTTRGTVYYDC